MPTLTVNGQRVKVDDSFLSLSPQEQEKTVDEIARSLNKAAPTVQAASEPDVFDDVWRSGATGLREGVETTAGTMGDVRDMVGAGVSTLRDKLPSVNVDLGGAGNALASGMSGLGWLFREGVGTALKPLDLAANTVRNAPTTEQIRKDVTGPLVKRMGAENVLAHEPQTTAGEYARTFGQFAPAAASPGSALRRIGMVAAPAFLSETGGQLTKGTALEPYARLLGGVGGGLAAARRVARRIKPPAGPTVAELENFGSDAFKAAEREGVVFNQTGVQTLRKGIFDDLTKRGFDPINEPGVMPVINRLKKLGKGNITFEGLHSLRRVAQNGWRPGLKSNNAAIDEIVERIDQLVNKADSQTILMGANPKNAAEAFMKAKSYWHRARKLETVEKLINRGEKIGEGYKHPDIANATRRELRKVVINESKQRGFTKDEMKAFERAVTPKGGERILDAMAGLVPNGRLSGLAQGSLAAANLATGNVAGLAAQGAGMMAGAGARAWADALAKKTVRELVEIIASGGQAIPKFNKITPAQFRQKLIQQAVAVEMSRGSAKAHAENF